MNLFIRFWSKYTDSHISEIVTRVEICGWMSSRILCRVKDGVQIILGAKIPIIPLHVTPHIPNEGIRPRDGAINVRIKVYCDIIIGKDQVQILDMFEPMF